MLQALDERKKGWTVALEQGKRQTRSDFTDRTGGETACLTCFPVLLFRVFVLCDLWFV